MIVTAPPVLARAREQIAPALERAVSRLHPEIRRPVEHHLGGSGKAVRPALALLSAEAVGADAAVAIPGAVAVELVHDYSLLHDDVIDGDTERRHRPTVWALFGVGPAIVAGDALAALALQVLLDVGSPAAVRTAAALTDANAAMIAGQADDMAFESRPEVTVGECLRMEGGKTGAILGFAASAGALLAGADDRDVAALRQYGEQLGLAFQAVDDLLGIWGDPAVTGKPAGSDLRQHKKSLPVVMALADGGDTAERLRSLFANGTLCDDEVARATALIESCGAREAVAEEAERRLAAALVALDRADLEPAARHELVDVARFVTARDT